MANGLLLCYNSKIYGTVLIGTVTIIQGGIKLVEKIKSTLSDFKTYWKIPMPGRHMTFKEIAAYSGGGIGAYMIITLGTACLLGTGNTLISSTLAVDPMDMYWLYAIAVLANIPLTGIRANIIDNTRNKAGKYRPYIVSMAIPTAIICLLMVWFPYEGFGNLLTNLFGNVKIFGESIAYISKCALILIFNLLLHFFYYFFYDGYENLIHVLSPNTQERADVSSVKSVVYSFAPTVVNLLTPLIAKNLFHTNTTDIRVYRFLYPILAVIGILLCIVVYKNTEEKIVQAKTHVVQIKFADALREVAKNKYFWIISLAGWIGFLESAYLNILYWLYNYGGACSGNEYSLIYTIYGNASLWGMLLAPFCIRRWGKKMVLVVTNIFNVIFILMMLPVLQDVGAKATIWLIMGCLYLNAFMGAFAHILNPAIQADIRDYQQYKSGERIDGMFSAVATIGTIITLATSSVLPFIYEQNGLTKENAIAVTSNPTILNRMLGDGKTVGQLLAEQLLEGQDNYANSYSALYDPTVLKSLLQVLIVISAVGALMNIIPYFWYDFNEKKQKSVVRVLRVRALFEDYSNGVLRDSDLVETVDIIRSARENVIKETLVADKELKRRDKKSYREAVKFNEEIEISKFVCDELDKYSRETFQRKIKLCEAIYAEGLAGLKNIDLLEARQELSAAKALPKTNDDEKDYREFAVDLARNKIRACKTLTKYYKDTELVRPDFEELDKLFKAEDKYNEDIKELYRQQDEAKKAKDTLKIKETSDRIKALKKEKEEVQKAQKAQMDIHAKFNNAAKPYLLAEKLLNEKENFTHLDEISERYEEAKIRVEAERAAQLAEQKRLDEEKTAQKAAIKAEKEAAKAAKNKK